MATRLRPKLELKAGNEPPQRKEALKH